MVGRQFACLVNDRGFCCRGVALGLFDEVLFREVLVKRVHYSSDRKFIGLIKLIMFINRSNKTIFWQ